jgi:signal transduction histidine kinase
VEVADNGGGIMPGKREEIFLPFFTAKEQGTGLGLSIAKKIVEAHQGRIYVRDAKEGGTVFVVLLPLGSQRWEK